MENDAYDLSRRTMVGSNEPKSPCLAEEKEETCFLSSSSDFPARQTCISDLCICDICFSLGHLRSQWGTLSAVAEVLETQTGILSKGEYISKEGVEGGTNLGSKIGKQNGQNGTNQEIHQLCVKYQKQKKRLVRLGLQWIHHNLTSCAKLSENLLHNDETTDRDKMGTGNISAAEKSPGCEDCLEVPSTRQSHSAAFEAISEHPRIRLSRNGEQKSKIGHKISNSGETTPKTETEERFVSTGECLSGSGDSTHGGYGRRTSKNRKTVTENGKKPVTNGEKMSKNGDATFNVSDNITTKNLANDLMQVENSIPGVPNNPTSWILNHLSCYECEVCRKNNHKLIDTENTSESYAGREWINNAESNGHIALKVGDIVLWKWCEGDMAKNTETPLNFYKENLKLVDFLSAHLSELVCLNLESIFLNYAICTIHYNSAKSLELNLNTMPACIENGNSGGRVRKVRDDGRGMTTRGHFLHKKGGLHKKGDIDTIGKRDVDKIHYHRASSPLFPLLLEGLIQMKISILLDKRGGQITRNLPTENSPNFPKYLPSLKTPAARDYAGETATDLIRSDAKNVSEIWRNISETDLSQKKCDSSKNKRKLSQMLWTQQNLSVCRNVYQNMPVQCVSKNGKNGDKNGLVKNSQKHHEKIHEHTAKQKPSPHLLSEENHFSSTRSLHRQKTNDEKLWNGNTNLPNFREKYPSEHIPSGRLSPPHSTRNNGGGQNGSDGSKKERIHNNEKAQRNNGRNEDILTPLMFTERDLLIHQPVDILYGSQQFSSKKRFSKQWQKARYGDLSSEDNESISNNEYREDAPQFSEVTATNSYISSPYRSRSLRKDLSLDDWRKAEAERRLMLENETDSRQTRGKKGEKAKYNFSYSEKTLRSMKGNDESGDSSPHVEQKITPSDQILKEAHLTLYRKVYKKQEPRVNSRRIRQPKSSKAETPESGEKTETNRRGRDKQPSEFPFSSSNDSRILDKSERIANGEDDDSTDDFTASHIDKIQAHHASKSSFPIISPPRSPVLNLPGQGSPGIPLSSGGQFRQGIPPKNEECESESSSSVKSQNGRTDENDDKRNSKGRTSPQTPASNEVSDTSLLPSATQRLRTGDVTAEVHQLQALNRKLTYLCSSRPGEDWARETQEIIQALNRVVPQQKFDLSTRAHTHPMPGVFYRARDTAWCTFWLDKQTGKRLWKTFTVRRYGGFNNARSNAITSRIQGILSSEHAQL